MKVLLIIALLTVGSVSIVVCQTAANCGDESKNTIVLKDFSLQPSPVVRPTVMTFNLLVDIKEDLVDPIQTDIKLEKKVLIWIKVPCKDDVGSCTYASWCDVCKTCACPLKAGTQQLTLHMNLTSDVPSGEYRTDINFKSATGQTGCVKIQRIRID